jgi:hypothetical protein
MRVGVHTGFRQGLTDILIDDTGAFEWSRRTARTITLYVRTLDGSVTSNRLTIR